MSAFEAAISLELQQLQALSLDRRLRTLAGPQGPVVVVDGHSFINYSSNDYLGLSCHPEVVNAAHRALKDYGFGVGSARLLVGNSCEHEALERELCEFKQYPAAILFSTGYHANVGTISALVGPQDAVYSDALNHASMIDGCRLSGARIHIYPHGDVDRLDSLLVDGSQFRRRLIVTDAVFGMDGDVAPLAEISKIAKRRDAIWMVDEAHATGVFGPQGRGILAEFGLAPTVAMGTMGKALGCFGAFVCGSRVLVDYLRNRARTFIFTTALPPALAAAARQAVRIVASDEGDRLRAGLRDNCGTFCKGLQSLGLVAPSRQTNVFPLVMGSAERALSVSAALEKRGVLALPIRPPTVPEGTARLRFAMTAAHRSDHIRRTLEALTEIHDVLV